MSIYTVRQSNVYPFYKKFYKLSPEHIQNIANIFETHMYGSFPNIKHVSGSNKIPSNITKELHEKYNGGYSIILSPWDETEITKELNNLTDYFTEKCRIKCKFFGKDSPENYWKKNSYKIIAKVKQKYGKITQHDIREELYQTIKFCNNFQVSLAISVLRIFSCKKWLDISAGWGDRLIAAILYGCEKYTGVDPNDCLHKYYNKIISKLSDGKSNFELIHDGFENAKIDDNYDLVFSSPPFFDREFYSESKGDSLINHKTEEEWYTDFLLFSVKKASSKLISGGHMVLYIDEGQKTSYIPRLKNDLNKFMKYNGIIYVAGDTNSKLKKLYVWKKL